MNNYQMMFKEYIKKYPFEGKFYYHFYKELYPKDNFENYYDFVDWYDASSDTAEIKFEIKENLKKSEELFLKAELKWYKIRETIKIKYPTKKSMTVPIGLFDN